MKKFIFAVFVTTMLSFTAQAEGLPQPVICVVSQTTLEQSSAFKSIVEQLEKKRADVQKELANDEKALKEADKKLAESQKKLSEKDFATERQKFEKRVHEVQAKIEVRRAQMEVAFEEAKKKVYEAFLKVANEVKKEIGANAMFYKETVVTADDGFDVSDTVLSKLNQALPKVQVSFKSEPEIKKLMQQQAQPTL